MPKMKQKIETMSANICAHKPELHFWRTSSLKRRNGFWCKAVAHAFPMFNSGRMGWNIYSKCIFELSERTGCVFFEFKNFQAILSFS